jgi:N-acetylglucosaminyldiphosphoundecaprenol N-acetyl-beta-D-mannosaminyltransferase
VIPLSSLHLSFFANRFSLFAVLMPPTITLLNAPIHRVTSREAVDHIIAAARSGVGGWVVTPNLDILRRLVTDTSFAQLCKGATLRLPDGMPLVWASRLQKTPLPERVTGADLIWSLTAAAAENNLRVFLLGGNPGAAIAAAAVLTSKHPALRIAGTLCPDFGFEKDPAKVAAIVAQVCAVAPDIVYVALGSPKQEHLIKVLRPALPNAWFLGIGISFSFVSGEVARAPTWMQRAGLEWFHRLLNDPARLFVRYIIHGLPFAARLLATSFLRGLRGASPDSTSESLR